jgi:murein hydrolase activator
MAAACVCLAPAAAERARQAETEAQLKAVQAEIARIHEKASRDQAEAGRMTRELKRAELSVGAARDALASLHAERAQRAQRRAELASQREQREQRIATERSALAAEARAAYLMGRSEPLKLLLNQRDPARAGRMLAYYGYFGRARAGEIDRIASDVRQLDALDAQLADEDQHLAALEAEQHDALGKLEQARAARSAALASLEAESRTSEARLKRLQQEQAGLESLLRELRRAMENAPPAGHGAFARLRGQLAWPVAGRVVARFGEARAGAVKWDGILIDTQRGTEVRAVSDGRVIFADWLPGLGLLIILDHGDGYLSLYGHNERLYKAVGERVAAGDAIAAAGDSGGSPRPELYFEIRKAGKPVDPRPWFRAAAPEGSTPHEAARR